MFQRRQSGGACIRGDSVQGGKKCFVRQGFHLDRKCSMAYAPLPALAHPRQELISCLAFDTVSDVLWSGSASGSVTAHYPTNVRGVTYPATNKGHPVTRLVASEKDVRAISESGMGSWAKGGMNRWYYR